MQCFIDLNELGATHDSELLSASFQNITLYGDYSHTCATREI